jgi:hypothetical protein
MSTEDYKVVTLRLYAAIGDVFRMGDISVRVTGMDIMRYRNGPVVEPWSQFDDLGLLQQLGLFTGPDEALPVR